MIHYLVMQSAVEYEKIGAEMLCNLQMFLQLMFIILQGVTIDVFVVIWVKQASRKTSIQKKNG